MEFRFDLAIKRASAAITKKVVGPRVKGLVVESETGLFVVDPEDEYGVGRKLRKSGRYGVEELKRITPLLTSESRVLIVGAHIGTLAIPASRHCHEVAAIEANPASFALLQMNIDLNRRHNCRPMHIAASDENGVLEFLLNRVNSGGSKRLPKVRKYMYYYDDPEVARVQCARLDDYLDGSKFDVVVMDIEGSEYHALKGMQNLLAGAKVLFVEFVPHHFRYVSDITVEQFLSVIAPHFNRLTIPSKGITVGADEFERILTVMFEQDDEDGDLKFEKV
ncbi:MAG: FkbM family methyltransferase [bacterium]|nr:FkbM family methyltransferase [bacterium]